MKTLVRPSGARLVDPTGRPLLADNASECVCCDDLSECCQGSSDCGTYFGAGGQLVLVASCVIAYTATRSILGGDGPDGTVTVQVSAFMQGQAIQADEGCPDQYFISTDMAGDSSWAFTVEAAGLPQGDPPPPAGTKPCNETGTFQGTSGGRVGLRFSCGNGFLETFLEAGASIQQTGFFQDECGIAVGERFVFDYVPIPRPGTGHLSAPLTIFPSAGVAPFDYSVNLSRPLEPDSPWSISGSAEFSIAFMTQDHYVCP